MKNKIRIVSVLVSLSFLVLPLMSFAAGPVLPMSLQGTIKLNAVNMATGTILKAYCGNTNTEIGTTTLTVAGQYGPENSSLPVNNCDSVNIFVQAIYGGQVTEKKDTGLTFSSTAITTYNIAFTSSSEQSATPVAPSNLAAIVDSQTAITLSWVDNSNNETRFEVWKNGVKLVDTAANAVTYQATGLTAGATYVFKVKAANVDEYSAFTSEVSVTTLSEPVSANATTGLIVGDPIDDNLKIFVNDSTNEIVLKGSRADAIGKINVVGDISALSSISGSSDNIIVGKQAIALGTASGATTSSAAFNTAAKSTSAVVETIVFVPVNTSTATGGTAAKRVAVVIPELTLIKNLDSDNLTSIEIRPPAVQSSATVENAIKSSFAQSTAPVSVKAAVSIPASVSGIKFYAADGTTAQYIDICMDKSAFTITNANDVLVYYSLTGGNDYAIDTAARSKTFTANQFCFQTNHLSSFAGAQANSKSVACTQSGASANASYTAGNVTVTWNGSAWSAAANCSWSCNSGYTLSAGTCTAVGGGTVIGGGGGGGAAAPVVAMPSTTTGEVTATKAGGGTTTFTSTENTKATVKVPANAVSTNTDVVVAEISTTAAAAATAVAAVASGKSLVGGYIYDITAATSAGAAVTTFSKYITITLTYKTSQITGLKESSLTINYWDEDALEWVALDTTVYKTTNKVTAKTLHLTYFAIIGEEGVDEAMTIDELKAAIADILAQIQVLQAELNKLLGVSVEGCTIASFDRSLKQGMSGDDVKCLQIVLNSDSATRVAETGVGSFGNETTYFGSLTKEGVIKFQEKYASDILAPWNLTEGTGFIGSTTLDKLNSLLK